MKHLLICLALLVSVASHAIVSAPISNTFLGTTGLIDRTDSVFITIKNRSGSSIAAGSIVVPEVATYADGASVTTATGITNQPLCVSTEVVANGAVSNKCQVWGYYDGLLHGYNGTVAATKGYKIYLSSSYAGYGAYLASPAATQDAVGIFLETSQASEGVKAFIRLL